MKKILTFFLLFSLLGFNAKAYDFTAICATGQTLAYSITSDTMPYTVSLVRGDASLSGDIEIPESVEYNDIVYSVTAIGDTAFFHESSITSITVPNTVTSVGERAFYDCRGIRGLVYNDNILMYVPYLSSSVISVPEGIKTIHRDAFIDHYNLSTLTIPSSVTDIGSYSFRNCTNLSTVNFNAIDCNATSAFVSLESLTTLNFASNVTRISDSICFFCSNLVDLVLPDSLTYIGKCAFLNCVLPSTITIPENVTYIGEGAFHQCTGLSTLYFNATNCTSDLIEGSSSATIFGGSSLSTVIIGENVTRIPNSFLWACQNVQSLTIPESTTIIGNKAFLASGLTEITIPENVTEIGGGAFWSCTNLTTVNYNAINCTSAGSSSQYIFKDCSALTTVNIGENVTNIPDYLFYKCTELTSVTFSNSVTRIGYLTFGNCSALPSVTLGNSVATIDDYAFSGCIMLTELTINSTPNIGDYAFRICDSITEINAMSITPPTISSLSFPSTLYDAATVWTPCPSASIYRSNSQWRRFTHIQNEQTTIYNIAVQTADANMGDVSGDGGFTCDTEVTLTATPNDGYRFLSWNDGNEDNPRTITVAGDSSFVASFKAVHTITASAGAGGMISPNGEVTIDDGADQQFTISPNTQYRIVSVIVDGTTNVTTQLVNGVYTFVNVTADHTITATFEEIPYYTISVSTGNHGSISPSTDVTVMEGENQTFTFSADACYEIGDVRVDGATVRLDENNTYTFTNVTANHTVEATFDILTYTISLTASEHGSVTHNDEEGDVVVNCGDSQSITIVADDSCRLVSVMVDGVNVTSQLVNGVYTFTNVTADHTIDVVFEEIPLYTISVSTNNDEFGSVTGSGTYMEGTDVTITATPSYDYHFVSWDDNNTDNPRTFTATSDGVYVANFARNQHTITALSADQSNGSVTGGGTYDVGEEVVLTALPNAGYRFLSWSDDNTDNPRTIVVDSDSTFIASFRALYTISVIANNDEGGSVSGGGIYDEGAEVVITATPNVGYCFIEWNDASTDTLRTITVTSDSTFVADFSATAHRAVDTTVTSYVTIDEHTFYVSGVYSYVIPSDIGCDTIVDLTLQVLDEPETYDISPNPAKSMISISSENYISYVEFYTIGGRLVMQKEVNANSVEINVEGLVSGVYFVRLYGECGHVPSVQRFVKE
ncbi:MAG: leucine-rich repeat domain-containing protein [Bacteroidales bacterium]|nr:leucine-rich repeat domain-containing protein [Bacteroidales bacterium]